MLLLGLLLCVVLLEMNYALKPLLRTRGIFMAEHLNIQ